MLRGSAKRILAAADEAGAPIVRIALTHYHDDHSGSVDALREALPDAELILPARETRILNDRDVSLEPGEPEGGKVRPIKAIKAQARPRARATGDRVGSLEAIATPGHSPGHLAFLDTRDRHVCRRRRLLDDRRRRDDRQAVLALPAARDHHLERRPRARVRAQAARARAEPPGGRTREDRGRPARRDGRGDREGGSLGARRALATPRSPSRAARPSPPSRAPCLLAVALGALGVAAVGDQRRDDAAREQHGDDRQVQDRTDRAPTPRSRA